MDLEHVRKMFINAATNPRDIDRAKLTEVLQLIVCDSFGIAMQRIEIVDSPSIAFEMATKLTNQLQDYSDEVGLYHPKWLWDFFVKFNYVDSSHMTEALSVLDMISMCWDTLCMDECFIVIRPPKNIDFATHSVEWHDGSVEVLGPDHSFFKEMSEILEYGADRQAS